MGSPGEEAEWGVQERSPGCGVQERSPGCEVQERRLDGESGGGTPDGWGVQERTPDVESRRGGWMGSPGEEAGWESGGGTPDGWGVQERSPGCGVKERKLDGESTGGVLDGES